MSAKTPSLKDFLELDRQDIAKIVDKRERPRCVAIMLDGTRRLLKLEPKYHDDSWLYYKDHIRNLIYKSIKTVDMLFDMGIEVVVGPLASFANLHRKNFMPKGLKRLLEPLLDEYSLSVCKKHNASISFYGDLDYAKSMRGGELVEHCQEEFKRINPDKSDKRILIGIGFSTDRETSIVANKAIEYFSKTKRKPSLKQLITEYFGFEVPPIDIFIRSNEVRVSGGLTPLLTSHGTQFYFPISPGVISFSERTLRRILYDYLFSRVLSLGKHEHRPIGPKEAKIVKKFYFDSKSEVLGIGRRVGDIWIHQPEGLDK